MDRSSALSVSPSPGNEEEVFAEKTVELRLENQRLRRDASSLEAANLELERECAALGSQVEQLENQLAAQVDHAGTLRGSWDAEKGVLLARVQELENRAEEGDPPTGIGDAVPRQEHMEALDSLRSDHEIEVADLKRQLRMAKEQSHRLSPDKAGSARHAGQERRASAALSAADPLLREQQKLKDLLAKSRREVQVKRDALDTAEAQIAVAKKEAKRSREMRTEEQKRWRADMEAMKAELSAAQQNDHGILRQVGFPLVARP
jgi:chromosome segregation ATPase